jgi:hypothetical protein
MKKLASRKLWLAMLAAILPILCQAILPDMPTEKIVVSVVGLLGGVFGIAAEDVQKIKQGVTDEYQAKSEESPSEDAKG